MFSAGGQVDLPLKTGELVKMPASFGRISKYKELILDTLKDTSIQTLTENWHNSVNRRNRLKQWCELCAAQYATTKDNLGYDIALEILENIFSDSNINYDDAEDNSLLVAESENLYS